MKNNEKPLNNLFIKFIDFKLTPSAKKNYKTLLIYKNSLIDSNAILVTVKMGIRKFLSAYVCSECNEEFYKSTLESYFHEKCSKILNEEKNLVKHVYSIHILHMRTIQWKLNQSTPKLNEIPINVYLENFKKSLKSQEAYAKYLPSPGQTANFSWDILKKILTRVLTQDYQSFQKDEKDDPKKEEFLNFALVLEKAYMFDNLQVRFPGFLDNHENLLSVRIRLF